MHSLAHLEHWEVEDGLEALRSGAHEGLVTMGQRGAKGDDTNRSSRAFPPRRMTSVMASTCRARRRPEARDALQARGELPFSEHARVRVTARRPNRFAL